MFFSSKHCNNLQTLFELGLRTFRWILHEIGGGAELLPRNTCAIANVCDAIVIFGKFDLVGAILLTMGDKTSEKSSSKKASEKNDEVVESNKTSKSTENTDGASSEASTQGANYELRPSTNTSSTRHRGKSSSSKSSSASSHSSSSSSGSNPADVLTTAMGMFGQLSSSISQLQVSIKEISEFCCSVA